MATRIKAPSGTVAKSKAAGIAAIKAAEKRGAARIEKLVERTGSPKVREMKRLICDAAKLYKGKPAELAHFYETIERMLVDKREQKRETRERSIKALDRGIMHLADICDLLKQLETGEVHYFCAEAQATFARAALSDAGTEMEQALHDLGLFKIGGYFVPRLADELAAPQPAQGAGHA